jgi:hypothetical protein
MLHFVRRRVLNPPCHMLTDRFLVIICIISLLWTILLSLDIFFRWAMTDITESVYRSFSSRRVLILTWLPSGSLVLALLLINAFTAIMLPIL